MTRDLRIDSLKGLLIILVILGHVITHLDNINQVNHAVMGAIYIFHMPLFILLSGYFSKRPDEQSPSHMWRGILSLLTSLVIFHVLYSLWASLLGVSFFVLIKSFPYGVLWYLLSLIYWRIMLYYTPQALFNKPWLYIGIAVALSILSGLTHLGNTMSIQRTLNFYVFFLLGYYYRHGMLPTKWWNNNILHGAICLVLLPIIFWLFPRCGNFMNGADHYALADLPQKALILMCSISTSLLVFNVTRSNRLLSNIGRDSLFYFLYHIFFVNALVIIDVMLLGYRLPSTFPFILIYTTLIVMVLMLMHKIKLFQWLVHPYSWKRKTSL